MIDIKEINKHIEEIKKAKDEINELPKEQTPLWMPAGSIRAILSIGIVAAAIVGFLGIGCNRFLTYQEFLTTIAIITAFYYTSKKK